MCQPCVPRVGAPQSHPRVTQRPVIRSELLSKKGAIARALRDLTVRPSGRPPVRPSARPPVRQNEYRIVNCTW